MPKVFVSYSHDSPAHTARVLALADRLRQDGLDVILDQYEGDPPEGWPRWMDRQILAADVVLLICTETYYKRVMGQEAAGIGKGVKWEGNLIYQHIYQADSEHSKFIPVLFADGKSEHVPTPLQGKRIYRLDGEEGYQQLYWRVTNQHQIPKPPVGELKTRPAPERLPLFPEPEPLSAFDKLKKAQLEQYLATLQRQYQAASAQLQGELNAANKIPLEHQLQYYEQQIRETAQKLQKIL